MTKVKICGMTNETDARWAASLGVDYIGFNFWKGTVRKISVKLASGIIKQLPTFIRSVGVFVNEDMDILLKIAGKCDLKVIQLHGEESPEYCSKLKEKSPCEIIKAFKIKDEDSLCGMEQYDVDYFLLDAYVPGMEGGTGETFSWDFALKAKDKGRPIFLAGGLTPENVQEAIEKVKPHAVDVASGVERLPKRKDYEKMKQFMSAVSRAG